MRVIIVTASFPRFPGGGAKVVYEHAAALARAGHEVTIVHSLNLRPGHMGTVDRMRHKVRDARQGQWRRRITWVRPGPGVVVRTVPSLEHLAALPRPHVYLATFWSTTPAIRRWGHPNTPLVQLMQAYETWAAPTEVVDGVWRTPCPKVVVSASLVRVAQRLGVPSELVHLAPNGIDHEAHRVLTPPAARPARVSFLAHQDPVKGLPVAIATAQRVHRVRPDVGWTSFGGYGRHRSLPSWVEHVDGATGVELVRRVYDRSTVHLCASRSEGFGLTALEAMACGNALVSTRNGGVEETAADVALFADVDDADSLAAQVLSLLDDDTERLRRAAACVERASEYSWERAGEVLERALASAMTQDPS